MQKIDFVVMWVDSRAPEWQAEYTKYRPGFHPEDSNRFREWGFFKFWFRAVERYAPWVNKVFLVTCGQVPEWLNLAHPKLQVVSHKDFMPAEYLPTFNSNAIELNIHRISGLSEQFVAFNDDMYLNGPVSPEYYFRNGLPCDAPREKPTLRCYYFNEKSRFGVFLNDIVNMAVLNHHFHRNEVLRGNWNRWHGFYMGIPRQILSYLLSFQKDFIGFQTPHFEKPFLKSVYGEPWEYDRSLLHETCLCKFRSELNLTIYYFRYWHLISNKFFPKMHKNRTYMCLTRTDVPKIKSVLHNERIKSVCLNDVTFDEEEFHYVQEQIMQCFEEKFPEKSSFEK